MARWRSQRSLTNTNSSPNPKVIAKTGRTSFGIGCTESVLVQPGGERALSVSESTALRAGFFKAVYRPSGGIFQGMDKTTRLSLSMVVSPQRENKLQAKLRRQAKQLGYELVPIEPQAA
jgi:hypothetical protein